LQLRNKIVPRATYNRVDRFNLQVSETTERMARLFAMAVAVFDNPAAAIRFLANAHPELDHRTPLEAALTEIGGREVEEIIERGLHGLPA
jgi:putative toxin-antitoxin system antitoxin component (TIGR02293 family)